MRLPKIGQARELTARGRFVSLPSMNSSYAQGLRLLTSALFASGFWLTHNPLWAALGQAYPDWMHVFNAQLLRSTHANDMRWK